MDKKLNEQVNAHIANVTERIHEGYRSVTQALTREIVDKDVELSFVRDQAAKLAEQVKELQDKVSDLEDTISAYDSEIEADESEDK